LISFKSESTPIPIERHCTPNNQSESSIIVSE